MIKVIKRGSTSFFSIIDKTPGDYGCKLVIYYILACTRTWDPAERDEERYGGREAGRKDGQTDIEGRVGRRKQKKGKMEVIHSLSEV